MPGGRPLKFESPDVLWLAFEDWRDTFIRKVEPSGEIPDIEGFCDFVGAWRDILNEYEKKDEFSVTVKKIKNWIYYRKKQLAMANKMNPAIFIFDAKNNAGYIDKTEQDITTAGEKLPAAGATLVDSFIKGLKRDTDKQAKPD